VPVALRRYHEGREIPAGVATPLIEAAAALSRSTRAAPGDGALDLDQRSCLAALIDRAADNLTVIVARRLRLAGQAEQQVLDRACRAVVARLRGRTPALVAPDRFWDANDVADRIRDDVVLLLRGLWGSVTAGRDALGPEIPRTSWSFAAKVALLAFLPVTLLGAATVVALRLNVPWLKGAPVAWWSVIGWAVVTLLVGIDMGMSGGRPILAEAVKTLSSVAALVKGKEEGNAGGKG